MRWECLDRASVGGRAELELLRRGDEFAIRSDGRQLMGSRAHASEDALGEIACDRLPPDRRLLVGGLGMGFTLAAALRRLGPDARVTVAELVPEVVAWNEGILGAVAGRPLADPRVAVHRGDVRDLLAPPEAWDAVVLDVDNGPDALTHPRNAWLYAEQGLAAARRSLRPGGALCVWSAGPDPSFERRIRSAGLALERRPVRERGDGGARHLVWIARRKPATLGA